MQAQQKEIQLYKGPAPGSENWNWKEGINNNNSAKVMTVYNVVQPYALVRVSRARSMSIPSL
jgi:hypothetical protein